MGAVTWQTVQATFFNFSAFAVQLGIDGVWDKVAPERTAGGPAVAAPTRRPRAPDRADPCRRSTEAAELAPHARPRPARRTAARSTPPTPGSTWPDEPLAAAVARAHAAAGVPRRRAHRRAGGSRADRPRGRGAARRDSGDTWSRKALQATRVYSDEQWDAAVCRPRRARLADAEATFTAEGAGVARGHRDDHRPLGAAPWEHLGEAGAARLLELAGPMAKAVVDAGTFGRGPSLG